MATKRQLNEKVQEIHLKHNREEADLRNEIDRLEDANDELQNQLTILQRAHSDDLRQVFNLSSAYDIQQKRVAELEAENATLSEQAEKGLERLEHLQGVIQDFNIKRSEYRRLVLKQGLEINEKAMAFCVQLATRSTSLPALTTLHAQIVRLLKGEPEPDMTEASKEEDLLGRVPVTETAHESRPEPHVFVNERLF